MARSGVRNNTPERQSVRVAELSHLVITRRTHENDAWTFQVWVDGELRDRIGRGNLGSIVRVSPGQHILQLKINRFFKSREMSFVAETGKDAKFDCVFEGSLRHPLEMIQLRQHES
jgi:hypothetical protein